MFNYIGIIKIIIIYISFPFLEVQGLLIPASDPMPNYLTATSALEESQEVYLMKKTQVPY